MDLIIFISLMALLLLALVSMVIGGLLLLVAFAGAPDNDLDLDLSDDEIL
jgi:hypothetical protein